MKWLSGLLVVTAGCAFAEPPPPPMRRSDVETALSLKADVVKLARTFGVVRLSADDVIELKKAGASDELVKVLIASRRDWDPAADHDAMHDPFAGGPSKICTVCGGWVGGFDR